MAALVKVSVVEREEQMAEIRRIVAFELARLPDSIAEQHGFEMGAFKKIKTLYSEYIAHGGPL